jgi:glycosyltransferase involved in cell wall biosynthesis
MNVSFIIPVLNGEKYIRRCLDSILKEASNQDEIIVVDNGSSDATVSIVQEYGDVFLRIHPDLTVSALRNRGAELAGKDLLAFIDSDCILCAGWRAEVIRVLEDTSIHATGASCEVPEDAGWIEKAWFSQKPDKIRKAKYINTGHLIVRKGVFSNIGGFDESLVTDEDCEFGERLNREGYYMLEDPALRVIHLGNPVTLGAFYAREKWHATSVLESGAAALHNLPTLMSIFFAVMLVFALASVLAAVFDDLNYLWFLLLIPVIPLLTAIYRAKQFNKYCYIPALTLLWGIFYLARVNNMVLFLAGRHRE